MKCIPAFTLSFLISALILNQGCKPKLQQKGLVYVNDFENMKGWSPKINLTKFPVFEGTYAGKVDTAHAFGPTLQIRFDEISPLPVRKLKYSMWIYLKSSEAKGKIVASIEGPDHKSVYWDAQHIQDAIKESGKWIEMKGEFEMGKNNSAQNIISIYPWSTAKEEFYVDNIRIEFVL